METPKALKRGVIRAKQINKKAQKKAKSK